MGNRSLVLVPFLVLLPLALPGASPQAGAQRLQELERRFVEERAQWLEFAKSARSAEERAELAAAFPREDFVPALEALAAEAKGTDLAARAWLAYLRIGALLDERELFTRALDRLVAEHVESTEMGSLALELVYGAPAWSARPAAAALRTILAKTPHADIRAGALAELALLVGLDDAFGAEGRAEAEQLLARIEREHGSADFIGMTGAEFAAGARHEITQLRVGAVAPDFEASDETGTRFKLSDYRGQVVLLDFWGFV
ncbi:MAG TPA: hypothetical protein VF530_02720 [Planctomycetota bacterium]